MLTKTDYLLFLEAPLHLWAKKHDQLEQISPSQYDLHLMEQGRTIEKLAQEHLEHQLKTSTTSLELTFQHLVTDGNFLARMDALVYDPAAQAYDIYEIKSASSLKKEHYFDAAFQRLVAEANFTIRHTYLVHVNKDYTRQGALDLDQLFQIVNVDEETEQLRQEILEGRKAAWQTASLNAPDGIEECLKPKTCPCPSLCHPDLPDHSIFDLPRLHYKKARQLKSQGVLAIQNIPDDFPLSDIQKNHHRVVKSKHPIINHYEIQSALDQMVYPLYFLDYETYNPAVPEYDHYHPYQHVTFQYSLDVFQTPEAQPIHHEFLAIGDEDPAKPLLEHLLPRIGAQGSVIVWNKSFEAGRNKDMAGLYPEYASHLENMNARIFDLMEIFSKGSFIHPDFHGSASIKNVLPVMVEDLNYEGLPIPKGDEAMMAWVALTRGQLSPEEIEQTRKDLLQYCALDTLAMVKIWQALRQLVK